MDDTKWLTVEEICDRLQVHAQTVRRWLRAGELHGVLIGDRGGYRVHPEDLAAFLRARGYTPQPGREAEKDNETRKRRESGRTCGTESSSGE
jgi:excisionase family DNA binding protein